MGKSWDVIAEQKAESKRWKWGSVLYRFAEEERPFGEAEDTETGLDDDSVLDVICKVTVGVCGASSPARVKSKSTSLLIRICSFRRLIA